MDAAHATDLSLAARKIEIIRIVIGFALMKDRIQFRKWTGIALTALCLASSPLAADEILLNSDFAKETDSWSGDFSNDSDPDNPLQPRPTGSVTLDLREHRAVRIFQGFNADTEKLVCNVSFTLSAGGSYMAGAKVSDVASDVSVNQVASNTYNPNTGVVTLYMNGNYATYQSPFQTPVIILADPDDSKVQLFPLGVDHSSLPLPTDGKAQPTAPNDQAGTSYTVHMTVRSHRSYRIYLAFPPGSGSVTITKISLQPDTR
jgi:hypothetical protein